MEKTFKSFLKDNWHSIFLLFLYCITGITFSYSPRFYGFEKIVIVLLIVILIEMRLNKLR